jgi:hypothetical protein
VTVSARQQPPDNRPPRYVVSARSARPAWTALFQRGSITSADAYHTLEQFETRVNLTGLGAFLPIEPFS